MYGVVLKILIQKPKKPNSANRKCVLVRLSNGKRHAKTTALLLHKIGHLQREVYLAQLEHCTPTSVGTLLRRCVVLRAPASKKKIMKSKQMLLSSREGLVPDKFLLRFVTTELLCQVDE
ncbi:hypothetical protein HW555_006163 [Spodoptera exigua]|uniref:Uncharacterized protein n=1 Tax=Spodoptera exigua TaxID=7107 RepID=A0A835L4S4_SPOEX|nr:hypothetical protein HW555_006163 [Spodoptera exigua]